MDDELVIVLLVKGLRRKAGGKGWFELPGCLFLGVKVNDDLAEYVRLHLSVPYIMLLYDFLEAGIVELSELGELVHVGDDLAEVLLLSLEVLLDVRVRLAGIGLIVLLSTMDQGVDLALLGLDAAYNLAGLDLLEGEDLVELRLKLVYKVLLIFLGPIRPLAARGAAGVIRAFEDVLEVVVVDVVVLPVPDLGRTELLAEPEVALLAGEARLMANEMEEMRRGRIELLAACGVRLELRRGNWTGWACSWR